MPASAGSTRTPPVSVDLAGEAGERRRVGREAQVAAQPLEQRPRGEDAAVERPLDLAATRQATVGSRPPDAAGRSSPTLASTNTPVP